MAEGSCPKCNGRMEEGFILDRSHGYVEVSRWVEGPPQTSFWFGLKVPADGARQVTTYRCSECGYLESYAG